MYPSHLGPGDRVDFFEPPAEGPILGYSDRAIAALTRRSQFDERATAERINLYGYVMNRPVNFTDPSGMKCSCTPACPSEPTVASPPAIAGAANAVLTTLQLLKKGDIEHVVVCSNLGAIQSIFSDCNYYFCGSGCGDPKIPEFGFYKICPPCGVFVCLIPCDKFKPGQRRPPPNEMA
jgi:hypothetical protein